MQLLVALTRTTTGAFNISHQNKSSSGANLGVTSSTWGDVPAHSPLSGEVGDFGAHLEAVVVLTIFVSSVVVNCLMFFLFAQKPSLLTMSYRFVLNLGACNVLTTFSTMPVVFISLISKQWVFGEVGCQISGFLTFVSFISCSLTLVVISIDRYLAVLSPLRYKMKVTVQRSWIAIAGVWIIAVLVAAPPLLGWNNYQYHPKKLTCTVTWHSHRSLDKYYSLFIFVLGFLFPLVVILVTYAAMFRAAMQNSARTSRLNVPPPGPTDSPVYRPISKRSLTDSRASLLSTKQGMADRTTRSVPSHFRRDLFTTARTSFVVISSFIIGWFPFYLCALLESFLPETATFPVFLSHLCFCLALASSVTTPVVYALRNSVIRKEMERTFFPRTKTPPKLTSFYQRRIVNTKVVSRGNSVESVIEAAPPIRDLGFTNCAFDSSKCFAV